MASVKGKLFEFFVCKLLLACGFRTVQEDEIVIFDGGPGTMIQGLGQIHNADVLLEPPVQTPFYFPTRLLVECKCYSDRIGLPFVRNALGLRTDINEFDIVTEEILINRKSSYDAKRTIYPMKRYSYQVAVASLSGFKTTAISFAQTHRIPLISFSDNAYFEEIRRLITNIEALAKYDTCFSDIILKFLKNKRHEIWEGSSVAETLDYDDKYSIFKDFINEIVYLTNKIVIGLLEDGTILFMIKEEYDCCVEQEQGQCEIYWNESGKVWVIKNENYEYWFELPREIYENWIKSVEERKREAIRIKQEYFSRIVLFEKNTTSQNIIRTLHLSNRFIELAKRNLNMDNDI